MHQITEEALVDFHKEIEREKESNLKLLSLIRISDKASAKKSTFITVLVGVLIILILGLVMVISYYTGR